MKTQNRLFLPIITVLMSLILISGNNSSVFGQVRIVNVVRMNDTENNRSIAYLPQGGQSSLLVLGTDKGNVYYYKVDKNGGLLKEDKQYDYHSRGEDTIRNISFDSRSEGYFLTNDQLFPLSTDDGKFSELQNFRNNAATSFPVLWSMGFADDGRVCVVGVYYKNKTNTIDKQLFSCTEDIKSKKPDWRAPNFSLKKSKFVQLTDIYFNGDSEGWVSGTDGVDGIIWYSENGAEWKEEAANVSEPLLSIAGVNDKLYAVGLNGLIVRRSSGGEARSRTASKKQDFKPGDRVKFNAGKLSENVSMDFEVTGRVINRNGDLIRIKVEKISPNSDSLNPLNAFSELSALFEKLYINQDDVESDDVNTNSDKGSSVKWVTVPAPRKKTVPVSERLNSIKFSKDGSHGFIAGNNGTIFYTINGGESWELLSTTDFGTVDFGSANLYSMTIDDLNKRCYIAGSEGKVVIISFGNKVR